MSKQVEHPAPAQLSKPPTQSEEWRGHLAQTTQMLGSQHNLQELLNDMEERITPADQDVVLTSKMLSIERAPSSSQHLQQDIMLRFNPEEIGKPNFIPGEFYAVEMRNRRELSTQGSEGVSARSCGAGLNLQVPQLNQWTHRLPENGRRGQSEEEQISNATSSRCEIGLTNEQKEADEVAQRNTQGDELRQRDEFDIVQTSDGKYRGQWKDGLQHGSGHLTMKGATYEGDFHKGKRHGEGVLTWDDGRVYRGQFVSNEMSGSGSMTFRGHNSSSSSSYVERTAPMDAQAGQKIQIEANGKVCTVTLPHGIVPGQRFRVPIS